VAEIKRLLQRRVFELLDYAAYGPERLWSLALFRFNAAQLSLHDEQRLRRRWRERLLRESSGVKSFINLLLPNLEGLAGSAELSRVIQPYLEMLP
jgi:hypothetical protein